MSKTKYFLAWGAIGISVSLFWEAYWKFLEAPIGRVSFTLYGLIQSVQYLSFPSSMAMMKFLDSRASLQMEVIIIFANVIFYCLVGVVVLVLKQTFSAKKFRG